MNQQRAALLDQITGSPADQTPTKPMSLDEMAAAIQQMRADLNRMIEYVNEALPGGKLSTDKSLKPDTFWGVKRKG